MQDLLKFFEKFHHCKCQRLNNLFLKFIHSETSDESFEADESSPHHSEHDHQS